MRDRTADELAIRNLVARAAHLNDGGDLDEYMGCWTEDVGYEVQGNPVHGRAALRETVAARRQAGIAGPGTGTCHLVLDLVVEFDAADPDAADSRYYLAFVVDLPTAPRVRSVYLNRDRYRRTPDGWRISARTSAGI